MLLLIALLSSPAPTATPRPVGTAAAPAAVNRDLGQAARAIRIRRSALDGFRPPPVQEEPTPVPAVSSRRSSAPTPTSPSAQLAQQESYWRNRVRALNEAVRSAEQDLQATRRQLAALSSCPRTPGSALEAQRQAIAQAQSRLQQARDQLDRLPDEARHAGAAPGWLR